MKSSIKQPEPKKLVASAPPQSSLDTETSVPEAPPLTKVQAEITATYEAHMEVQKEFEEAFKNVARQDKLAYEDAEKRFQAYKTIVELALMKRETSEQAALDAYKKTLRKAGEVYQEAMQQALSECQQNTKEAGKVLSDLARIEYHPTCQKRVRPFAGVQVWLRKVCNL